MKNSLNIFPKECISFIESFLEKNKITFINENDRTSLYGLFENNVSYKEGYWHNIYVNSNLKGYAAFLVFLHEASHFLAHDNISCFEKPHGKSYLRYYKEFVKKAEEEILNIKNKEFFEKMSILLNNFSLDKETDLIESLIN